MATLTRDEAHTRAELLDTQRYTIHLDLTTGEDTFRSTTTVHFTAHRPGDTFIELRPTTLHHATLDGRPLDTTTLHNGRLPLPTLTPGHHQLHLTADMPYSSTGEGMHRFTDPTDHHTYLYTQCAMTDAPQVYAAFDQPDLKATFHLTVTAPHDWTVLANGTATPDPHHPGHWNCAPTPPISTYLFAVAAGPWHTTRTTHAGLPFGIHVRRSLAEHLDRDTDEILDITRRTFDRYHQIFDEPYPFDSYDQAFVPEFNHGAMENPGLVTFRDDFIHRSAVTDTERQTRGMVIAHEMAHMWFGNLVTLQWWDDIWLNESFAEYMGYQVLADSTHYRPWTEFATRRKAWGYDADQRPTTHPVAPHPDDVPDTASAWLNFDGISYAKGASALRQLVAWLGEKTFLAGINDHFARHRFANATLTDFLDSLARHSHRDVHAWADRWLRTPGPDTLTAQPHPTPHTTTDHNWHLTITHHGTRPHRLRIGAYTTDNPDHPGTTHDLELPPEPGTTHHTLPGPHPDLIVLNDADLTYAKTRIDPHTWHTATHHLHTLPDPLTRAVLWNAARDMVRDTHLTPTAYLDAARHNLRHETDTAIAEAVIDFARHHIADRYLDTTDRTHALATLTDIGHAILRNTHATPALRLTAIRTLIATAPHPDEARRWLTGNALPGGSPTLDQELRWQTLHRLAVLGATDNDEITAETHRDPSATGTQGAARCRAALPDPEAKATAWHHMFGDHDTLSNYLFTATAQGFWHPEHHDLLTDYVPAYFPAVARLGHRRGHALATAATRHAFPRGFTDPRTLRLGDDLLAGDTPTPAVRRGLADQLDDLRRALRIRAAHPADA